MCVNTHFLTLIENAWWVNLHQKSEWRPLGQRASWSGPSGPSQADGSPSSNQRLTLSLPAGALRNSPTTGLLSGEDSLHSWTWLQHGRQGSRETSEQHDIYTKKKACFKEEEHDMWSSPEPRLTSWIGFWLALRVSRVSRKPWSTASAACQVSRLGRAHSSIVRNWNMRFNMNTWCV